MAENIPPIIAQMIEKLDLQTVEAQNAFQTLWNVKQAVDKALLVHTTKRVRAEEYAKEAKRKKNETRSSR